VRFKIDENLPVEFASLLCQAGDDAASVVTQQLQGKPDSIIVDVCVRKKRVLVTLD
jgi:predicted nuclease of predicted toxin-antitoxin system